MCENNLTTYEMLLQIIIGNGLSVAEESEIKKVLNEREKIMSEEKFQQYTSELNRCQTPESHKIQNIVSEDMQKYYICPKDTKTEKSASRTMFERNGIRFIDNPYTAEETAVIREWVEDHPFDVRGLAVSLWLSGGIAPEAIINLRTSDCWSGGRDTHELIHMGNIAVDRSIFQQWDRFRIVKRAMELHQAKQPYVFMVYDRNQWSKLNGNAIQLKMFHICRNLGIRYRKFSNNEIILF